MTNNELSQEYFDWLTSFVCDDHRYSRRTTYRKLMQHLYDMQFTYTIPLDDNRAADGIDLRYRFADERRYPDAVVATYLDNRPCSVLEMMIALAIRCEEHIMEDYDIGNRTGQWFWNMIVSLGLGPMTDQRYNRRVVDAIIVRFLDRDYERDGSGGLFTVPGTHRDMRNIEIWYQMNMYLETII